MGHRIRAVIDRGSLSSKAVTSRLDVGEGMVVQPFICLGLWHYGHGHVMRSSSNDTLISIPSILSEDLIYSEVYKG